MVIIHTVCPKSLDIIYIVSFYINWVKTSWTDSTKKDLSTKQNRYIIQIMDEFPYPKIPYINIIKT